ncbi:MAG: hypothetical protein WBA76_19895 [Phormidesmis sp.]
MPTQPTLIERVKQGEVEAIAQLINCTLPQHLNQPSAHVQIRRRGGEYRLLVEAPNLPEQQSTVRWIQKGLGKLAIAPMQTVTIYGKSQQSAKPSWQYSFCLASSDIQSPEKSLDLSEYCFVRNRALLSGSLTPPAKAVTRLVLSFSALPNAQKLTILSRFTQLLRRSESVENASLESSAQDWIAAALALESNGLRQLSIWLSRYCARSAETLEQLSPPVAEISDSSESTSAVANPAVATVLATQAARAEQLRSPETTLSNQDSWLFAWAIPTVWALCLMIFVTLGIHWANRTVSSFSICEQAAQSTAQCTLAVQLVGDESAMTHTIKSAVPLAPKTKAAAAKNCNDYASTHVISALKIDSLAPPSPEDMTENAADTSSSQTTEVFPGVLLTEVTQARSLPKIDSLSQIGSLTQSENLVHTASPENKEIMRLACVGYSSAQNAFKEIAADEIPTAWPNEPYNPASALNDSTEKALGIYNLFISFGANTLFTAIGVFVAVILFSCYRCYTLKGVYQVALVLGGLETVVLMIPGIGFFISLPLGVAAIGLASRLVKDFTVDWTEGYKALAKGAIVIVAIRCLLFWLLYGAIAHFIV